LTRKGDDIMLITVGGMVNRTHVREISAVGRNTQGVRVMGLKEGDKLAPLAKLAPEEIAAESPVAEETPAQPEG
jgi:DNA gyrase subunit A